MVHGQLLRGEGAATPMAMPQRQPVLPPAAPPQLAGFVPLALDLLLADFNNEMIQNKPPLPDRPASNRKQNPLFHMDGQDIQDKGFSHKMGLGVIPSILFIHVNICLFLYCRNVTIVAPSLPSCGSPPLNESTSGWRARNSRTASRSLPVPRPWI